MADSTKMLSSSLVHDRDKEGASMRTTVFTPWDCSQSQGVKRWDPPPRPHPENYRCPQSLLITHSTLCPWQICHTYSAPHLTIMACSQRLLTTVLNLLTGPMKFNFLENPPFWTWRWLTFPQMSPALLLLHLVHLIICLWKSTSLAILRELPQHQWVWQLIQADWQGLQAAISLQDWSLIRTSHGVNWAWEFYQRNLLSL